jgi:hypothetical protein
MIKDARRVYDMILRAQMELIIPYPGPNAPWYRSA